MLPVFGAVESACVAQLGQSSSSGTKWLHRGTFRLGSCSQLCLHASAVWGCLWSGAVYSPVPLRQPSGDGGSAPIKFFLRTAT